MATGGWSGAVTYQQMVDYVGRVVEPLEEHVSAHDTWHLGRLTADDEARKANRRAAVSQAIAGIALLVTVIFDIVRR